MTPPEDAPKSDGVDETGGVRIQRRRLILRSGIFGAAVLATAACVPAQPVYQRSSGVTDADPNDGPGNGRGGVRRSSGVTDSDPNDGPGRGRGGYRGGGGVTDRDPNDGPGRGRGGSRGYSSGLTDSDPNDGPGRGRSGR